MTPEEVPDELIGIAHMAFRFSDEQDAESALAEALAAVLPMHEKQVRAKVAEEIAALNRRPGSSYRRGLEVAEATARGAS
jgi:hypothetical protein